MSLAFMEGIGTPVAVARHRVRAALRRAGWAGAPRRGWVTGIAPAVVSAADPDAGDWCTESVTVTDTAVVVAVVRCRTGGRRRVLKMPCTAEGADSLRRQAGVLAALHGDARLAGWLGVVPRPRGSGEIAGRRYWVEDAVPGRPPSAAARDDRILAAATGLIGELHARTAEERTAGAGDLSAWVDRPLTVLETFYAGHDRYRTALRRLGARLSADLTGRRVRTSWIHGDFWLGNLLVSGGAVTGVVDWDRAAAHQLPMQDLLHLSFFLQRARDGGELGDLVVRSLRDGLPQTTGVPVRQLDAWLGGVPHTTATLLFWLRHISLYIGSEGHGDNRDWLRRNVHSVLARY